MAAAGAASQLTETMWPEPGLTRIPYWLFQDPQVYAAEQRRLFQGPLWNFLCLAAEVPNRRLLHHRRRRRLRHRHARCRRRALCLREPLRPSRRLDRAGARGNAKDFSCVYHAWTYDRQGNLIGVAFKDGIKGKGGMPASFCMQDHGPRKLRVAELCGLVFGSFSDTVPPLEEYLGEAIVPRIERVLAGRKPVVLGRYTQALPNNWKLYMENVKDSYHASILHLFFTTFELNRLSQRGGIIVDASGGHHVSFSAIDAQAEKDAEYAKQNIRSESGYRLADPSLLQGFKEFADDITLQILSVFPTFVLQQIQNAIAVRQIVPRGIERTDLNWTLIGFADDTPEQRLTRLKQANLVGPAGYVSMEDGCVGGFVQRGIAGAGDERAVVEMGGSGADSSESRVTEASVRGFWKAYRAAMGM